MLFELVPNAAGNTLPGTGDARLSLGVKDIGQATRAFQARGVGNNSQSRKNPGGLISFFKDADEQ